jgi:hypothetical protein
MSWLLPYATNIPSLFDYMNGAKKQNIVWIGPMEAIIALAYKRFRPNAKLKIENFRITNDHSYSFSMFNYNFDLQSVKRSIFGGKSIDLLNLKNPVYYSHSILNDMKKEDRDLLLNLALQSTNILIKDTYADDQYAKDALHDISLILKQMIDDGDVSDLATHLNISVTYADNPLTKKNIELWKTNKKWIVDIIDEFRECLKHYSSGESYEQNLFQIRKIMEKPHQEIENYYYLIIKGT